MYRLSRPPTASHLQRPGHVAVHRVGVRDCEGRRVGGFGASVDGFGAMSGGPVGGQHHRYAPEEGAAAGGSVQHGGGAAKHHLKEKESVNYVLI